MAESQWVYLFDRQNGNALMHATVLEDGQKMPDNGTTVVCPNGLYDPYFDEQAQTWKSITKEEWEAKHTQKPVVPSQADKVMNDLGLQMAQLTAENKQLKQSINQLGLQLAQLTMKDKKENGGN